MEPIDTCSCCNIVVKSIVGVGDPEVSSCLVLQLQVVCVPGDSYEIVRDCIHDLFSGFEHDAVSLNIVDEIIGDTQTLDLIKHNCPIESPLNGVPSEVRVRELATTSHTEWMAATDVFLTHVLELSVLDSHHRFEISTRVRLDVSTMLSRL